MNFYRTHTCKDLISQKIGQEVTIAGWVHGIRDHGGLIFIDLRDHTGVSQCVINEKESELMKILEQVRLEAVVFVSGKIVQRDPSTVNPNIPSGKIEVLVDKLIVENNAEVLPFSVSSDDGVGEELRLKYRFLDLRRENLQKMLKTRSDIFNFIRQEMLKMEFTEVQTPLLTGSSPEGARDFVVPSRKHPGKFYALPQAPQIFKQLLMASGLNRYFQIAPCFRDEDARADRTAGEFYQLDLEMSFVTQEDVFKVVEQVFGGMLEKFTDKPFTKAPFPRITYQDSIKKYASDKPDLRNPLVLADVTEVFKDSDFSLFANLINKGSTVNAIPAFGAANRPRSFFDKLNDWARSEKQGGLGYIILDSDGAKGPIASKLTESQINQIAKAAGVKTGDAIFFVCGKGKEFIRFSGIARNKVAEELDLFEKDTFKVCWVVNFPMFELDDSGNLEFSHNPFSMPIGDIDNLTKETALNLKAFQYDLVCNGVEISSGAIRNHKLSSMYKIFKLAGYSEEAINNSFGALIKAFKYGAPPHGGAALGLDRILMLMLDVNNIRNVIAFPLNQSGEDHLMQAPSAIDETRLKELSLIINSNNISGGAKNEQ